MKVKVFLHFFASGLKCRVATNVKWLFGSFSSSMAFNMQDKFRGDKVFASLAINLPKVSWSVRTGNVPSLRKKKLNNFVIEGIREKIKESRLSQSFPVLRMGKNFNVSSEFSHNYNYDARNPVKYFVVPHRWVLINERRMREWNSKNVSDWIP